VRVISNYVKVTILLWYQSSLRESSTVPTLSLFHLQEFIIIMALEVSLFLVANMITSSFNNPSVNLLNDCSSVYYDSFNKKFSKLSSQEMDQG